MIRPRTSAEALSTEIAARPPPGRDAGLAAYNAGPAPWTVTAQPWPYRETRVCQQGEQVSLAGVRGCRIIYKTLVRSMANSAPLPDTKPPSGAYEVVR